MASFLIYERAFFSSYWITVHFINPANVHNHHCGDARQQGPPQGPFSHSPSRRRTTGRSEGQLSYLCRVECFFSLLVTNVTQKTRVNKNTNCPLPPELMVLCRPRGVHTCKRRNRAELFNLEVPSGCPAVTCLWPPPRQKPE